MLNITPISAFKDNYIWMLFDEKTQQTWVVDPGDATPVIKKLQADDLNLSGILLTHHHPDHSGGIADLLTYAGNIPVYGSHHSAIKTISHPVKQGDVIDCQFMRFQVFEIPGHTLDHIAFYGNKILFPGDTLFSAGCGRIFEGTPQQMYASLMQLMQFDTQTKIYCGHEYTLANLYFAQHVDPNNSFITQKIESIKQQTCSLPAHLAEEKLINPFLRCEEKKIIESVENYSKKTLNNPVDVFYHLREWKNNIAT